MTKKATKEKSESAPASEMKTILYEVVPPAVIDQIIADKQGKPGLLLGILETVQKINKYKYIPDDTIHYIAQKLKMSLAHIYSVVTFYSYFSLKPQGEHSITVCRGTACHTKGSRVILESIKEILDLHEDPAEEGEKIFLTTADKQFTLKTIACFGQCALAPVCEIDEVIFSNMTKEKIRVAIDKIKQGGKLQ
jgi:NADH-quinone oxidoreductase subunit E